MSRLLLVDDDAAGLEARRLIFERLGYHVSAAKSSIQARYIFSEEQPEIVLMDLRIPELADGLALIRDFRSADPKIRIIVLAGWPPDLEDRPEANMVDEILAKPVRSVRLVSAVNRASA